MGRGSDTGVSELNTDSNPDSLEPLKKRQKLLDALKKASILLFLI